MYALETRHQSLRGDMNDFWQDLRYGARTLLKNPGFGIGEQRNRKLP